MFSKEQARKHDFRSVFVEVTTVGPVIYCWLTNHPTYSAWNQWSLYCILNLWVINKGHSMPGGSSAPHGVDCGPSVCSAWLGGPVGGWSKQASLSCLALWRGGWKLAQLCPLHALLGYSSHIPIRWPRLLIQCLGKGSSQALRVWDWKSARSHFQNCFLVKVNGELSLGRRISRGGPAPYFLLEGVSKHFGILFTFVTALIIL